jgi:hypothetical protein
MVLDLWMIGGFVVRLEVGFLTCKILVNALGSTLLSALRLCAYTQDNKE